MPRHGQFPRPTAPRAPAPNPSTTGIGDYAAIRHSDGGTITLLYDSENPSCLRATLSLSAYVHRDPLATHGAKFETSARMLLRFARGIDEEIGCDGVTSSQVLDHLAGSGPLRR